MLTDSHCHILNEYYDNIDEILKNAKRNNVNRVISCADNLESCKEVFSNSCKYDNYYFALGIHPEFQDESYKEFESFFYNVIPNLNLVAVGEIGLDYHYENYDKEKQIKLFEDQLKLAEKENLPVIVHSREATMDTINSLKKFKVKGVIHAFSGSIETAKEYLKMGFYIGVGGVITFKNAKLKDVIKDIPLERIIVETDSPYLSPEPLRGKRNEPANVKLVAEFISNLKNVSINDVEKITENNVNNLFNLK